MKTKHKIISLKTQQACFPKRDTYIIFKTNIMYYISYLVAPCVSVAVCDAITTDEP